MRIIWGNRKIYISPVYGNFMKKILYVDDMKECYEKTKEALGDVFEIDWKDNYVKGLNAIKEHFEDYSAVVFDVNLNYNPRLKKNMQTTKGLDLIEIAKIERIMGGVTTPILCVSANGRYRRPALHRGADLFLWKKEFWNGKGRKALEELIKKV